ncbi:UDP-3-O-(3-hydroxymyristoyl)glucosamine N-acyltransferase, partial [bacterium]|nr:UDP-3-O-(3-hydroxymyristoyl)glucosamine N-acyltransferase [bacterium]
MPQDGVPLEDLAQRLGGRLDGLSQGVVINGVASLSDAQKGNITFLSDSKNLEKNLEDLSKSHASAVIAPEKTKPLPIPALRFENPYLGLAKALSIFYPEILPTKGIHPTAFVHERAFVHPTASIGPLAVVSANAKVEAYAQIEAQVFVGCGAKIGESAHIYPHVVVREGCIVGDRSILHSGVIVGSDGFGFTPTSTGHLKIPQVGIVEIGSDVEIGANVTIDRATMGKTIIGPGTKIDNLVHIAHNVVIGRNCIIVAQVGLSGSTIMEDQVTLAGQVGTVGHVSIGKGATVAARGVVT